MINAFIKYRVCNFFITILNALPLYFTYDTIKTLFLFSESFTTINMGAILRHKKDFIEYRSNI